MTKKYIILLFIIVALLSCKTKPPPIYTENKRNFQTLATKAKVRTDTIITKKRKEYYDENQDRKEDMEDISKATNQFSKNVENSAKNIDSEFYDQSHSFISTLNNSLLAENKLLSEEAKQCKKQSEEINDFFSITNINKLQKNIAQYYFNECIKIHGENYGDSIENVYADKVNDSLHKLVDQKNKESAALGIKINDLFITANSLAYEAEFIEANTRYSHLTWNLENLSHFKTKGTKLLPAEKRLRESDYSRYIDSVVVSIQRINAQYSNDSSGVKIRKVKIYVFIDGYADSENYSKNDSLSQSRALEIQTVFEDVFWRKMITSKTSNIIFPDPIFYTKGHGEEKPKLEEYIKFKPDGKPDQNRRLTIIKCVFYPEED